MSISSIDPTTGETLQTFEETTDAEVEAKLGWAMKAFDQQRKMGFAERAKLLRNVAEILDREKHNYGQLMTEEMGKTLQSAIAEVEKCAMTCSYYADHAAEFLQDEIVKTEQAASATYIRYLPIGPVLAVMPWNFPFWQVIRFAAPALMAGNVGLLKHASNVPRCALALEELFAKGGFSKGAFQTLLISSKRVAKVIDDPRVKAVTLTGSEGAGISVARQAGQQLKKVVLELGGSDPFIVMPSADIEGASQVAVKARILNNGQSCIAAKRFIVHEQVYSEFEKLMVQGLGKLKVGNPMETDTDVGPMATSAGREDIADQVKHSMEAGARLLIGGRKLEGPGFFYEPTALTDIPESSPAFREELFGPVALLFKVKNIDEAIALANKSEFGLGSSVWTSDKTEQERFVNELEAGQTFVNAMVVSDPHLPFGGIKRSGFGRELGSIGIREFVNIKSVVVYDSAPITYNRSE